MQRISFPLLNTNVCLVPSFSDLLKLSKVQYQYISNN